MRKKILVLAATILATPAFCEKLELVWEKSFDAPVISASFPEDWLSVSFSTAPPTARFLVGHLTNVGPAPAGSTLKLLNERGEALLTLPPPRAVFVSKHGRYYGYDTEKEFILFDWNGKIIRRSQTLRGTGGGKDETGGTLHISDAGDVASVYELTGTVNLPFPIIKRLVDFSEFPGAAFSSDGNYLAIAFVPKNKAGGPVQVELYTKDGRKIWSKFTSLQRSDVITGIAVSEHAERIAVAYAPNFTPKEMEIFPKFPIRNGRFARALPYYIHIFDKAGNEIGRSQLPGHGVALSPEGGYAVAFFNLWGIRFLETNGCKELWRYNQETGTEISSVSISKDGRRIAVGRTPPFPGSSCRVHLFDKAGTKMAVFDVPEEQSQWYANEPTVRISMDGNYILVNHTKNRKAQLLEVVE